MEGHELRRVDFAVDLAFGVAMSVAVGLVLVAGTSVGIAFIPPNRR